MNKKQTRKAFRNEVFKRDNNSCAIPGCSVQQNLDAHHITPRELMPKGGYVKENGISLCAKHHLLAEDFLKHGDPEKDEVYFQPAYLYCLIGSDYERAYNASSNL